MSQPGQQETVWTSVLLEPLGCAHLSNKQPTRNSHGCGPDTAVINREDTAGCGYCLVNTGEGGLAASGIGSVPAVL